MGTLPKDSAKEMETKYWCFVNKTTTRHRTRGLYKLPCHVPAAIAPVRDGFTGRILEEIKRTTPTHRPNSLALPPLVLRSAEGQHLTYFSIYFQDRLALYCSKKRSLIGHKATSKLIF